MKRLPVVLVVSLLSSPTLAQVDEEEVAGDYAAAPAEPDATPPPPDAAAAAASEPVRPIARSSDWGQWVYTAQYGWVFMPYGDGYTTAVDGYADPYMYVYGPAFGWTWVAAPWLCGWGPWPYFGVVGPWGFGWYGHGIHHRPWRGGWAGGAPTFRPHPPGFRSGRPGNAGATFRPQAPGLRTGPAPAFRPQAPASRPQAPAPRPQAPAGRGGGGHGGPRPSR